MDLTLFDPRIFLNMYLFYLGPNIFLIKITSMTTTTTTIKMGFDTIEINLVITMSAFTLIIYLVATSVVYLVLPRNSAWLSIKEDCLGPLC